MDGDLYLIWGMKNGNENAFNEFVCKYYPDILKFCYRKLNGNNYAEDITQETFQKFFRMFDCYKHYGKAKNYLYVIANNLCKDFYKKKVEPSIEEVTDLITDIYKSVDRKIDLEEAIKQLPEELEEIIILYYFQELKLKEIAVILDVGLPLLKYRIKKAKNQLRKIIGEEYNV